MSQGIEEIALAGLEDKPFSYFLQKINTNDKKIGFESNKSEVMLAGIADYMQRTDVHSDFIQRIINIIPPSIKQLLLRNNFDWYKIFTERGFNPSIRTSLRELDAALTFVMPDGLIGATETVGFLEIK